MNKIDILKKGATLVVGLGTNGIMQGIVKTVSGSDISKGEKFLRRAAGTAIAGLVSHHVSDYIDSEIDSYKKMIEDMYKDIRKEAENGRAETE